MSKYHAREIFDTFYLIALQGLNYVSPLIVFPYLMVVLGAEKFGYIGFTMSVIQYLMLFVDFGFNFSATKQISLAKGNQQELNRIFTSTFYAKIGLLLVSFFALLLISLVPRFEVYRETMYIMFLMVIGHAFTFVWLFQGMGNIRFISIFNMISRLSILPLTFIFVTSSSDYSIAALIQALVSIVSMIFSLIYITKNGWVTIGSIIRNDVVFALKESFPLFLSNAATSIYTISFVLLLGYFSTAEQVGQYSAVEKIMRAACYLIFVPISQAFYPKVVSLASQNRTEAIRLVKMLLLLVLVIMLCVFVLIFFFSPYLVRFLGKDYQDTAVLFKIIAFVPLFVGAGGVIAQLGLLALGGVSDKKNYQKVYFFAAIVALISILSTVPFYGANGATISLLVTEITVCLLMVWYGRKIIF